MKHFRNIIISFVAIFFLLLASCQHDGAVMQELTHIDSLVYHQHEKEALTQLQQVDAKRFGAEERAYHAVLLSMAMYKNYIPCTSDSAI